MKTLTSAEDPMIQQHIMFSDRKIIKFVIKYNEIAVILSS